MSTEQNDGKSPFEVMEDPIEMEFNVAHDLSKTAL